MTGLGTNLNWIAWGQPVAAHDPGKRSDAPNKHRIESLNDQAERCRRLAAATYNREVSDILGGMAEDYERTASKLSKRRKP